MELRLITKNGYRFLFANSNQLADGAIVKVGKKTVKILNMACHTNTGWLYRYTTDFK